MNNNKINIKNIYFKSWNKSEEQINNELQTTGFIYKQLLNKFYIKVTSETYQDIYEVLEKINKYNGANLNDSEIDYTLSQEEINKQLNNNDQQDIAQEEDILSKFNDLEFENTDRIEQVDKKFCEKQQQHYNEAIKIINDFISTFKEVSGIDLLDKKRYNQESKNKYLDWYKFDKIAELARETKQKFINDIIWHFSQKYSITINSDIIIKKYDFNVTYDNLIDEIFIQLDGFTFMEKADKEIKDKLTNEIRYDKIKINNNKFTVLNFASFEKSWNGKDYRITYYGRDRLVAFFKALTHYDSGKTSIYNDFLEFVNYNNDQTKDYWFTEFDFSYKKKVQMIRFYKNGKIDVKFKSHEQAKQFAKDYCGYVEEAA